MGISLSDILTQYRVYNNRSDNSLKCWAGEKFSSPNLYMCSDAEIIEFKKRLTEVKLTICDNVKAVEGKILNPWNVWSILRDSKNVSKNKLQRQIIYSSDTGKRPIGERGWDMWSGFQVIDMDIKSKEIATKLKPLLFNLLNKYNWFYGVVLSSSGKGLHVYTSIQVQDSYRGVEKKMKGLFYANFRHKFSYVYLATLKALADEKIENEVVKNWMDLAMFKPQQGAIIGYDPYPLINTGFFNDFIYVDFDYIEEMGYHDIDWFTHPDLVQIFERYEWFSEGEEVIEEINVSQAPLLGVDTHQKIHYKHNERWRLANTLVKLYGFEQGYLYMKHICANTSDYELRGDCTTAARHGKSIDIWAVNKLNNIHGFKIKIDIPINKYDEGLEGLISSVKSVNNPTVILESTKTVQFQISKNQYLGDIKEDILNNLADLTLLEAGAGLGKTEMVKSLIDDGKKIILVMPFTSTIKSKISESSNISEGWDYSFGNKKINLSAKCVAMTIDKFSRTHIMDLKSEGFDYIFIDESHLLFQSDYRPVMSKVIDKISHADIPIIMMTGTPFAETVFFQDIQHIKVVKEETRKKNINVFITDTPESNFLHMCRKMAEDISKGVRVLFPTNTGTAFKTKIETTVKYFLQNEFLIYRDISIEYYKKSNSGEEFMNVINQKQSISNIDILLCSNYLSVGVDIKGDYKFNVYFDDMWMPQEIEQFANRLRSMDLNLMVFISMLDSEGNDKGLYSYRPADYSINDDEKRDVISIINICNDAIIRNPEEYKYNPLITSIVRSKNFIEYNRTDNKYVLNQTAFKTVMIEAKYRRFVQQLPVMVKGMICYGYEFHSEKLGEFVFEEGSLEELKDMLKCMRVFDTMNKTTNIEELLTLITEDRLTLYKGVMEGKYEVVKAKKWREQIDTNTIYVKDIEVFEKVVPLFISMSNLYSVANVKDIFESCRNKNNSFNFAALKRMRILINIIYNTNRKSLDNPILLYINSIKEFVENNKNVNKNIVDQFIIDEAMKYIDSVLVDEGVVIERSRITVETIQNTFENIFKCVVDTGRIKKNKNINLKLIDMFWKTRGEEKQEQSRIFILDDFLETFIEK